MNKNYLNFRNGFKKFKKFNRLNIENFLLVHLISVYLFHQNHSCPLATRSVVIPTLLSIKLISKLTLMTFNVDQIYFSILFESSGWINFHIKNSNRIFFSLSLSLFGCNLAMFKWRELNNLFVFMYICWWTLFIVLLMFQLSGLLHKLNTRQSGAIKSCWHVYELEARYWVCGRKLGTSQASLNFLILDFFKFFLNIDFYNGFI